MPSITLELIAHTNPDYGSASLIELDLVNHVHKRIERFIYTNTIRNAAVPIAFLENDPLDAWFNLQIANRTYSVTANSAKLSTERAPTAVVVASAYSTPYEKIIVTNRTFTDERGRIRPLFWRHELPDNVQECEIVRVSRGNRIKVDSGFEVDFETKNIYTNYRNFFDPDTGAFRLFFVVCTDDEGTTTHELLNPQPVAKLADWEDIDLDTGRLTTDYPVYSKEQSSGGWNFYFNDTDTWFIKPIDKSLIQPIRPSGRDPDEPWFMRFSAGNFVALVNEASRRYQLPEFDAQPFIPSKPTVYSLYTKLLRVNRRVVAATRDTLQIDPAQGLHITIFIENVEGEVIKVLSTDTSREGERFGSGDVFFETDKILSWDNRGGFVALGIDIHRSWSFSATYYYEADDFEYNLVSLNPINNKRVYDHTFVFYMIPDVNVNDRSIFHLVVDHNGTIVETSQGPGGIAYPNLQLVDDAGNFNSDTVIGLKYISDIETDTFITRHTAGFQNDDGYMVIAEVTALDTGIVENQLDVDVRRPGGVPKEEEFDNAIRSNPRLLQSRIGYGKDGQEVPENAVMIVDAPLSLQEDYGGELTAGEAERLLRRDIPSAGYAVINWVYPRSELSGQANLVDGADLSWTWEGPSLTYTLYRRDNLSGEKSVVTTISSPSEGTISYTDLDVVAGEVYHYSVSITENSVEFPDSNTVSIRVR